MTKSNEVIVKYENYMVQQQRHIVGSLPLQVQHTLREKVAFAERWPFIRSHLNNSLRYINKESLQKFQEQGLR